MASVVSICNQALAKLGAYSIQSLDDATKEARECKKIYEQARDSVLASHDWKFASKRLTLAESTDEYTGWDYAYQYPTDCIEAREILDDDGTYTGTSYDVDEDRYKVTKKVEFTIGTNTARNRKLILTNKATAELRYTAKVTDPNLFSALFIDALIYRLASDLSQPIRASIQLNQQMLQMFLAVLANARAVDANETEQVPQEFNSFVNMRS